MEMIKSYINLAIKLIKEYFVISIQLHRKERKILSFNYDNFSKLKILFKVASVFVLFFAGYSSAIAQNEVAMPGGFHQFGENSSDVIAASESIDSVTVGAIMQYWAQPDPALLNPANSYVWTISPTIGTQTAGTPTDLATITFVGTPATGTITFHEVSAAGCAAADITPVNIAVIAKPTAKFGANPASECTQSPGSLTFTLPVILTSSLPAINLLSLNYTVKNPDGSTLSGPTVIQLSKTAVSFNVTLTGALQYGFYTVTLNSVSDRISIKSGVSGDVTANPTIMLGVNLTPSTGNVFHVTNQ